MNARPRKKYTYTHSVGNKYLKRKVFCFSCNKQMDNQIFRCYTRETKKLKSKMQIDSKLYEWETIQEIFKIEIIPCSFGSHHKVRNLQKNLQRN